MRLTRTCKRPSRSSLEEEFIVSELASTEEKLLHHCRQVADNVDESTQDVSGLPCQTGEEEKVEEHNSEIQIEFSPTAWDAMFSQMQNSVEAPSADKHQSMLGLITNLRVVGHAKQDLAALRDTATRRSLGSLKTEARQLKEQISRADTEHHTHNCHRRLSARWRSASRYSSLTCTALMTQLSEKSLYSGVPPPRTATDSQAHAQLTPDQKRPHRLHSDPANECVAEL
ncbi:hypothetical protein J4Q44_G00360350 [Coregonus suidteri]|uniref:Uncharacterized protein n=1 Tax=Coregonus suidteri TaxID=861788 RepID=A0AAN8KFG7_9TELE